MCYSVVTVSSVVDVALIFITVAPDLIFSDPAGAGFVISNPARISSVIAVSLCELDSIFVISHC